MALTGRTIYDWVYDFNRRAQAAGDTQRQRLWTLHHEAWALRETELHRALSIIEEGRVLAQALGEPWWVIFFVHRHVSVLVHNQGNYFKALDAAVRAVVEARKPAYDGCPHQLLIHIELISTYIEVDAVGYRAKIQEALGFLSSQKGLCDDHLFLMQSLRVQLELKLEHWVKAHAEAQLYFDLASQAAADSSHYLSNAYSALCGTLYHLSDWPQLQEHAQNGEVHARREKRLGMTATLQMWQALALQHEGKTEEARRLSHLAVAQRTRLGKFSSDYFEAYAAWHEACGQWHEAIEVRDHELSVLKNKGRYGALVYCHFERCRLLAAIGQLTTGDVETSRQAMLHLIDPNPMLARLEQLPVNKEP